MADWLILSTPNTWQELQEKVSVILSDCGFQTEVEKELPLTRGKTVDDVYGIRKTGIPSMVICECKYWETAIPKSIAQTFKSNVAESGASHGYMIAKKGFQSGTYEVVDKSYVTLLTWDEFQESFKADWLSHMVNKVHRAGIEPRSFIQYLISTKPAEIDLNEKCRELEKIRADHEDWFFFTFKEHYTHFTTGEISLQETITTIEQRSSRYLSLKPPFLLDFFEAIYDRCMSEIKKIEELCDGGIHWDPQTMLPY